VTPIIHGVGTLSSAKTSWSKLGLFQEINLYQINLHQAKIDSSKQVKNAAQYEQIIVAEAG